MAGAKLLVVEDEGIIAKDIHYRLGRMGYEVLAPVSTGNAAIRTTEENRPDLILMDIVLKGDMDGIQAASRIRERFDIPVVYLTANSDSHTVERAKITRPHGFLIKPFKDAEAQICIEMALYKHRFDRKLREKEEELATILRCVEDAVIATDESGAVTFINPAGETLTGWSAEEAQGHELEEVIRVVDEKTDEPLSVLAPPEPTSARRRKQALLLAKGGLQHPIEYASAPLLDEEQRFLGSVIVLRNVTERKEAEAELRVHREKLRELVAEKTKQWTATNSQLMREMNQLRRTIQTLQDANETAEAKAQAKSDFLANIGHDMRSPMRDVLDQAETFLLSDLTSDQRRHAEGIMRSVEALKAIVDDISEF
ncbi:MAG: response regulator [Candidatus Hydrogenedentes bacterium]|nr:response regulator [Candidatus Hydrogenedentota bacterium]